jgi:hypothetical protein
MSKEKETTFNNKFTLGLNPEGRPPVYDNEEALFNRIGEYFGHIDEQNEKPTITGLALFLGFESRQSVYDYAKKKEFSYIIKRAQLIIQNWYEIHLTDRNVTGVIFALKNMGWSDKYEFDNSSSDGTMSPNKIDLSKLSDKELIIYKNLQKKIEDE